MDFYPSKLKSFSKIMLIRLNFDAGYENLFA